ncbi:MAG: XisI protein [Lewinellaceae bacterium]|nr:XisI protein [Lewinellaceae bacterium]
MDKQLKYQKAILLLLEDYAKIKPSDWAGVQNQIIADRQNHHYQLVRLGWHEKEHIHYTVFHFDIIGGKVWVQENRTDLPIVDELSDLGIAPSDIVLGFQLPSTQIMESTSLA